MDREDEYIVKNNARRSGPCGTSDATGMIIRKIAECWGTKGENFVVCQPPTLATHLGRSVEKAAKDTILALRVNWQLMVLGIHLFKLVKTQDLRGSTVNSGQCARVCPQLVSPKLRWNEIVPTGLE